MKKSELKALLKIIVQEAIAANKQRLSETKGLSGFKKSKDSTEHTEKVATSKDLTGKSEPKETKEGKKLPVVKKPATPQKVGSIKEEILGMIREAIAEAGLDEMARTAGAVDPQYRKEIEPGKWVIMGHPNQQKYPDGSPTTAPKGPYVPKGIAGMGRPKKDVTEPATVGADANGDAGGEEDADDDSTPTPSAATSDDYEFIFKDPSGKTHELDSQLPYYGKDTAKYLESNVVSMVGDLSAKLDPTVLQILTAIERKPETIKSNKFTLYYDRPSKLVKIKST